MFLVLTVTYERSPGLPVMLAALSLSLGNLILFPSCHLLLLLLASPVACIVSHQPTDHQMHLSIIGDQAFLSNPAAAAVEVDPSSQENSSLVVNGTTAGDSGSGKSAALKKATDKSDEPRIWSGGVVPYFFHSFTSVRAIRAIRAGMREISAATCVHFVPVTRIMKRRKSKKAPPHVQIFQGRDGECWSVFGTHDVHPVSLSRGCWDKGTILHELMHVLGFDHSHTRPDRDSFLTVHWDNIDPKDWSEFEIRGNSIESRLIGKIPFDYESILMYGEWNGSRDDENPALTRKDGKRLVDLEEKTRLSPHDLRLVNKVYKCRRR